MTAYIIMTSANSFTGIGTTELKKANTIIDELNSMAKKAKNGVRFHIKEVSIDDDNDIETLMDWYKKIF